jgi:hypothetical protein
MTGDVDTKIFLALAAQNCSYEYGAQISCGSRSIRIQPYKTSPIRDPVDILHSR